MWPLFRTLAQTLARRSRPNGGPPGSASAPLAFLGLTQEELAVLRAGALEPHFRYHHFRRPKPAGGWREIAEPDPRLKSLQRRIARQFLAEGPHPAALAYRPRKSAVDHARAHAGAAIVVTADVRDFFPSTRTARVAEFWRARVEADEARLLTLLTADRGGLPQGAPTSPALSNLVNRELDERLTARATVAGARYTRYCDDLAFSWVGGFGPPADFERAVRAILAEFGYALHATKGWRVFARADEPEVTGVVLGRSGRVRLPDRVRAVMRALGRSRDPRDVARLEGYRGYEAAVTGHERG